MSLLMLPNDLLLDSTSSSSPRSGYDSNERFFGSDEEFEEDFELEEEDEYYSEEDD